MEELLIDNDLSLFLENNYREIINVIEQVDVNRQVKIVGAAKTVPENVLLYVRDKLGLKDFGENRVQEYVQKSLFYNDPKTNFHFIGKLQRNKVKYIIEKVCLIHSLDSKELADEINKYAVRFNKQVPCLVEINIGNEESKSGINPDDAIRFSYDVSNYSNIDLKGLMVIPPKCSVIDDYNYYYEKGYNLFDLIKSLGYFGNDNQILSMGMSDSYDLAIKHGSNLVRLGTVLFGKRN